IDGRVVNFGGKPARVGINPITLSADRETLYFGAMNGTTWYRLPARLLREGADDAAIATAIAPAGPKPISDGVATGADGTHWFTDL
ncbi:cupin, partial [Salinisphaera sp. USBA-960]|nr:cupin [Salifodinibacter halophilus]